MTQTPKEIPHWLGRFLVVGFLLLAGGCGLSDYEARMKETQVALDRFDEETRLLDEPIYVPLNPRKEGEGVAKPVVELFFRPPRGIKQNYDLNPLDGLLFRYGRKPKEAAAEPVRLPDTPPPPRVIRYDPVDGFQEVLVAWLVPDPNKKPVELKDFAAQILGLIPQSKVVGEQLPRPREAKPVGRPPFAYQPYDFEDPSGNHLSVNFLLGTKTFVAVVYKIEKGKKTSNRDVDKAIQLSLESLAVDADAAPALEKYKRQGGKMSSPPPPEPPPT